MGSTAAGGSGRARRFPGSALLVMCAVLTASSFSPLPRHFQEAARSPAPQATATRRVRATRTPKPTLTPTARPHILPSETPTSLPEVKVSGEYATNEVLVRFRRRADSSVINGCLQAAHATVRTEIEELSVLVLEVPEGTVGEALAQLAACPETRMAEPNYLVHAADRIPSDPDFPSQYGFINIRAPQGWSLSTGSPAVTIAIVDTGVDLGHPDLSAKIVNGYDFVNDDHFAQDDSGHGTHVAGIAAAITNNGTGVAGVSWGAHIMPVKVLDAGGNGTFAGVSEGITWAADNGAQVINLSLGGTSGSAVLQAAVDYAYSKGVVIVAAAGNAGVNALLYPARYPHVIAVGATDVNNMRAGFSNYGPQMGLMAPGVDILSTFLGGGYGYLNGTSMSTPYVSGLAAILRGIPGSGSPDAIAYYMESTALDLGSPGRDSLFGYGLIQMDGAIQRAIPATPTITPKALPGNGNGNAPSYAGGYVFATATFTPTATATFTPTPTMTATLPTGSATRSGSIGGPSFARLGPELPGRVSAQLGSDWPLGCGGSLLILMGVWQAWSLRRKGPRRNGPYLKMRK